MNPPKTAMDVWFEFDATHSINDPDFLPRYIESVARAIQTINPMLTTNTPGYVTLRNLLLDLGTREDDAVESYLQTLTAEDLYTLEQVANKEGMPMMAAVVHGHTLARKFT